MRWLVCGSPLPVKLYTDHQALLKVLRSNDAQGRIARWQVRFGRYWLHANHAPGKQLAIADGLSRLPFANSYIPAYDGENTFILPDLVELSPEADQPRTQTC